MSVLIRSAGGERRIGGARRALIGWGYRSGRAGGARGALFDNRNCGPSITGCGATQNGGLAGTINVSTRKPLAQKERLSGVISGA